MICTDDLTIPRLVDDYNEIECEFDPIKLISKKPKGCRDHRKCVPSSNGVIAIRNCKPEENTTVTSMLMSFRRHNSREFLISAENITHLIIRAHKNDWSKNPVESFRGKNSNSITLITGLR